MLDMISDVHTPAATRREHISHADLVISLVSAPLQQLIAEECIMFGKHFLSPAPLNEKLMNMRQKIEAANILFLCEMGFDPGLDHMSALQFTRNIQQQGGRIVSLHTHSGRLVAPEYNDNPWHCKTDDAKKMINTGREGAVYREHGEAVQLNYPGVFNGSRLLEIPGLGFLAWYPVHDSMGYIPLYGLKDAETVIRTNLCHPDFIYGWKNIIDLKLTSQSADYDTDGMTLSDFFKQHLDKQGFSGWLEQKMMERLSQTKQILEKLMQFMEVEQANALSEQFTDSLMIVDEKGRLENINLDTIKDNAAATVAYKMHEANLTLKQLFYLGMDDKETLINKGRCSAADVLELAIEKKLAFRRDEQDIAVMMHELEYLVNGKKYSANRHLVVRSRGREAAADTITAYLLGISARLILTGEITLRGLHIPIKPHIYGPILDELETYGIRFEETTND